MLTKAVHASYMASNWTGMHMGLLQRSDGRKSGSQNDNNSHICHGFCDPPSGLFFLPAAASAMIGRCCPRLSRIFKAPREPCAFFKCVCQPPDRSLILVLVQTRFL